MDDIYIGASYWSPITSVPLWSHSSVLSSSLSSQHCAAYGWGLRKRLSSYGG